MVIQISQNLMNRYCYHSRGILTISSKPAHNLLSNGWISDWTVSMVNQIIIKSIHLFLLPPLTPPLDFIAIRSLLFELCLLTNRQKDKQKDKQTNQCYGKHHLLCMWPTGYIVGLKIKTNVIENIISLVERTKRLIPHDISRMTIELHTKVYITWSGTSIMTICFLLFCKLFNQYMYLKLEMVCFIL